MLIDDNSDDDVYHFEDSFVMLMTMFLLVEKAWVSTCIGIGPLREKLRASRVFDILFTCCHLLKKISSHQQVFFYAHCSHNLSQLLKCSDIGANWRLDLIWAMIHFCSSLETKPGHERLCELNRFKVICCRVFKAICSCVQLHHFYFPAVQPRFTLYSPTTNSAQYSVSMLLLQLDNFKLAAELFNVN